MVLMQHVLQVDHPTLVIETRKKYDSHINKLMRHGKFHLIDDFIWFYDEPIFIYNFNGIELITIIWYTLMIFDDNMNSSQGRQGRWGRVRGWGPYVGGRKPHKQRHGLSSHTLVASISI